VIAGTSLELSRCASCQARFLPGDGSCPRCGSTDCSVYTAAALGKVLASTELHYPASGWHSPHRLALVEVADAVRILAIVEGALPSPGTLVEVRSDGPVYRARAEPTG
jgi:uncharacterized OB-fold protein